MQIVKQRFLPEQRLRRLLAAIVFLVLLLIISGRLTHTPLVSEHSPLQLPHVEVPETVTTITNSITGAITDNQPGLLPVVHISDGDTITVRMPNSKEETVRMLGVDTPEVKDPRKPVQCFGEAASAHTKQRLTGKSVRLEPDPDDTDRDKYGRLLRYVYLPDGTLYNAELIHDGYAFAYTVFPITKLDDFRDLEQDAREHNRGLWAGCNINESSQIKQTTSSK